MKGPQKAYTTVDEYIDGFAAETKDILVKIRETIKKELPNEVTEEISYGIPTFKLNSKYVIYFAGYSKHVSIYPIPKIEDAKLAKEIEPFVKGRGTLQFPLSKPIPYDLIRKMAKAGLKSNLERTKKY